MSEKLSSSPWQGRPTEEVGAYWYQHVQVVSDAAEHFTPPIADGRKGLAILGYAVDEGVRLNLGRVGAAAGPLALRERLAREPWHLADHWQVVDFGDITLASESLEETTNILGGSVAFFRDNGYITCVLGGGHDQAAAHYVGLRMQADKGKMKRIGTVNFDAHLDLRPIKTSMHSGTPFSLIAAFNESYAFPFDYLCIGAQRQANTPELFDRAHQLGAKLVMLEAVAEEASPAVTSFSESVDGLHITIDLDAFPCYVSPGVSAPAVDGLDYRTVLRLLRQLMATGKVIGIDIAECNPSYDIDGRTAKLGARLLAEMLSE